MTSAIVSKVSQSLLLEGFESKSKGAVSMRVQYLTKYKWEIIMNNTKTAGGYSFTGPCYLSLVNKG